MTVKNRADMERAISERADFKHRSYKGITTDQGYELWHWNTLIGIIKDGELVYGDMGYYSNTTSAFQGRILRSLSPKSQNIVKELFKDDKAQLKRLTKMMR